MYCVVTDLGRFLTSVTPVYANSGIEKPGISDVEIGDSTELCPT
jgi:hypothetical protein